MELLRISAVGLHFGCLLGCGPGLNLNTFGSAFEPQFLVGGMTVSEIYTISSSALTIEARIKLNNLIVTGYVLKVASPVNVSMHVTSSGALVVEYPTAASCGAPTMLSSPAGTLAAGSSYHVAAVIVEDPAFVTLYVNGAQVATSLGPTPGALVCTTSGIQIGWDGTSTATLSGVIDEMRVSVTDRYQSAFTPSSRPFSYDQFTLLLADFNDRGRYPILPYALATATVGTLMGNFVDSPFR